MTTDENYLTSVRIKQLYILYVCTIDFSPVDGNIYSHFEFIYAHLLAALHRIVRHSNFQIDNARVCEINK